MTYLNSCSVQLGKNSFYQVQMTNSPLSASIFPRRRKSLMSFLRSESGMWRPSTELSRTRKLSCAGDGVQARLSEGTECVYGCVREMVRWRKTDYGLRSKGPQINVIPYLGERLNLQREPRPCGSIASILYACHQQLSVPPSAPNLTISQNFRIWEKLSLLMICSEGTTWDVNTTIISVW